MPMDAQLTESIEMNFIFMWKIFLLAVTAVVYSKSNDISNSFCKCRAFENTFLSLNNNKIFSESARWNHYGNR